MFIWKLLSLRVCRPAVQRLEPSCLIYFRFKLKLNWKSWITLTPLAQDGLLQLKAAFLYFGSFLKKSYKINFCDRRLTGAGAERNSKGRHRHYKAVFFFISTAVNQALPKALSSTISLAEYLINCLGFNKSCQTTPACREKICLWAGQCTSSKC